MPDKAKKGVAQKRHRPPPAMGRDLAKYLNAISEKKGIRAGTPLPLGAHQLGDGANFAIFSRHATRLRLEFFDQPEDQAPSRSIDHDPVLNKTGDIWHVWVQGIRPGQLYGYRVDGPYQPQAGERFNFNKLLVDPYATAIACEADSDAEKTTGYDPGSPEKDISFSTTDDAASVPKSIFTHEHFHWHGIQPPNHSWSETVIYETHVRGFTIHPASGVSHPGTYLGLVEKIPYLLDLGVTAVELMPVMEFNENENRFKNPATGKLLKDYWGYNPLSFFAPKGSYCSCGNLGQQKLEFKEMVREFHKNGIEIILDVVLNHTSEGNQLGPTLSFRGLDNSIFYMLDQQNRRYYKDFTGTGNTINANHPVVRDLILDVLRYWVMEMHVDGFRFDLASVLGRDTDGNLLSDPPLLDRIAEDPILRDIKIIAEAWDAGGAYQVGSFSEKRWAEWNGRFRDEVRRFWRGDEGMRGLFASRICGSADIYRKSGKGPESSINFITCHDGFTLNDLVSFSHKNNEANGQENRDGSDANYSANYGAEGESSNPEIESVRVQQIKNFILTLFISRGVPMLLGGDEFRRSQQGNNNAYCQDNEISWHNWSLLEKNAEIFRFTRQMIALRKSHAVLRNESFYTDADIHWFDSTGRVPDWSSERRKDLACLILGKGEPDLFLMFNASEQPLDFVLLSPGEHAAWYQAADTSETTPQATRDKWTMKKLKNEKVYRLESRASAILLAR